MVKISVIIPTKNSEKVIERCLKSIKNQTFKDFEIINVDNYSKDNTIKISKKYTKVYRIRKGGFSPQKNFGAKKAKGKYILFIDSDMELAPKLLEDCYKKLKRYKALYIPERFVGDNLWGKAKALEKNCYLHDETISAARAFEKKLFLSEGGCDETLVAAEDLDLTNRLKRKGIKIGWCKEFITHYDGSPKFFEILRKKKLYARTIKKYIKKNPIEAKKQMKFIRPSFLRNFHLFLRHPILSLALTYIRVGESLVILWQLLKSNKSKKIENK